MLQRSSNVRVKQPQLITAGEGAPFHKDKENRGACSCGGSSGKYCHLLHIV